MDPRHDRTMKFDGVSVKMPDSTGLDVREARGVMTAGVRKCGSWHKTPWGPGSVSRGTFSGIWRIKWAA